MFKLFSHRNRLTANPLFCLINNQKAAAEKERAKCKKWWKPELSGHVKMDYFVVFRFIASSSCKSIDWWARRIRLISLDLTLSRNKFHSLRVNMKRKNGQEQELHNLCCRFLLSPLRLHFVFIEKLRAYREKAVVSKPASRQNFFFSNSCW